MGVEEAGQHYHGQDSVTGARTAGPVLIAVALVTANHPDTCFVEFRAPIGTPFADGLFVI